MNKKQVIETLEMENELICFNPLTGEEIQLEYVNDLNRNCYEAHQEAIRLINNSIPVEWIEKRLQKAVAFTHSKAEGKVIINEDVVEVVSASFTANVLSNLLEDWEKENG